MGNLVNSLRTIPAGSTGEFKVLGGSDEGNEISIQQVTTARNKRWLPMKNQNGNWVEITTSIPGDVNGDGHVSSVDVTALYNYLLNGDSSELVNGDQDGDEHPGEFGNVLQRYVAGDFTVHSRDGLTLEQGNDGADNHQADARSDEQITEDSQ